MLRFDYTNGRPGGAGRFFGCEDCTVHPDGWDGPLDI